MASKYFNQEFKDQSCDQLKQEIKKLRDEIAKRVDELKRDPRSLPATGPMSIKGHLEQMSGKQTRLRKIINEFNSRGCGGDIGDAWKYASAEEPIKATSGLGIDSNTVSKLAVSLGLAAVVVAAVFSAPAVATGGVLASLLFVVNQ